MEKQIYYWEKKIKGWSKPVYVELLQLPHEAVMNFAITGTWWGHAIFFIHYEDAFRCFLETKHSYLKHHLFHLRERDL